MGKHTGIALVVAVVVCITSSLALADWDVTFSNGYGEHAYDVQQTADGGYIVAGSTRLSGESWRKHVWLIKTDTNGNEIWNRTFGEYEDRDWFDDYARSVLQTPDGGYIFVGTKFTPGEPGSGLWYSYVWLLKTDSNGTMQWERMLGEPDHLCWGTSFQKTADRGYIIAGGIYSGADVDSDVLLIKTDALGIEQWRRTIGGVNDEWANFVQQISDGGYIIAGENLGYLAGYSNICLIKTDENGVELWNSTFGGEQAESCNTVLQTADGGYLLGGSTFSFGAGYWDMWLIKTDENGNELWNRTFGGTGSEECRSMKQTTDGGYVLAGYTSGDMWLVKTDQNGNELWNRTFGGEQAEGCNSVQQTADDGYIMVGNTYENGSDDIWLVKVDGSGCTTYCRDADGDLYGDASDSQCLESPSYPYTTLWEGDCDDDDPDVNPLGTEVICTGIDEDCNEATPDEPNADGDPVSFCDGDCDDTDPRNYPGNQEICDDGVDNDCDGFVDTDDFECPCPELTQISCVYPPDGAVVYETPHFTWNTNAGTACHSFAVDLSLRPSFSRYWSTYEHLHQPIRGDTWVIPHDLWDRVPVGRYIYWRVRGADIDHGPFTVTTSAEVRRFYKW